jgi:hypothetical protein
MRLSGSPPFACRQLREVYYRLFYTARAIPEISSLRDAAVLVELAAQHDSIKLPSYTELLDNPKEPCAYEP